MADFHDKTPDDFLCPMTCDVIINPVKCEDRLVYEELAINKWLLTWRHGDQFVNCRQSVCVLNSSYA